MLSSPQGFGAPNPIANIDGESEIQCPNGAPIQARHLIGAEVGCDLVLGFHRALQRKWRNLDCVDILLVMHLAAASAITPAQSVRITAIAEQLTLPRETVRRRVHSLHRSGQLVFSRSGVALSEEAARWLSEDGLQILRAHVLHFTKRWKLKPISRHAGNGDVALQLNASDADFLVHALSYVLNFFRRWRTPAGGYLRLFSIINLSRLNGFDSASVLSAIQSQHSDKHQLSLFNVTNSDQLAKHVGLTAETARRYLIDFSELGWTFRTRHGYILNLDQFLAAVRMGGSANCEDLDELFVNLVGAPAVSD